MEHTADHAEKKGKSKLLIILAIAIVLLLIGVGALVFLLVGDRDTEQAISGASGSSVDKVLARQENDEVDDSAPPIYVELGKFHSNLKPEQDDTDSTGIVVIEVSLKVKNAEEEKRVKDRVPEIRDRILRLLNTRTVSQLEQPQEKSRLSDDIFIEANRVLNPELAGVVELRAKSQAFGGGAKTGHDVQTDTSGVHENGLSNTAAAVISSIQDDAGLTPKLPVQRVLFTSFIVQRL